MIQQVSINYLTVLAATVASMVIGFVWYGSLFGKVWMQIMSFDKKKMEEMKKKGMAMQYIVAFVSTFIMVYILAHFVKYVNATTIADAAQLGFWIWLGFFATTMLGMVLWEGKPLKLYVIHVAHHLVTLIVAAGILAFWP